jgi:predicted RNase H-like nuclease (RuvC/YqgF family)
MEIEKASLDDVQDGFDSLVLAFFNSIRGYNISSSESPSSSGNQDIIHALTVEYDKTMKLIDNLKGNNRSAEDQELEIQSLQSRIELMKSNLSLLENNLQELNEKCDQELKQILTDELLTKRCGAKSVVEK